MSEAPETKSRAQQRIQSLTAELAAAKAAHTTLEGKYNTLSSTIEALTTERNTAQQALVAAQAATNRQLAAGRAGIWEAADLAAAEALHGVYGGDTPFADWIAQDRAQLPAAVQGLLPAAPATTPTSEPTPTTTPAATTPTTTTPTTTTPATTPSTTPAPPIDPGGTPPVPAQAFTPAQLAEIQRGGPLLDQLLKEHGSMGAALAHVEQRMRPA